MLVCQIADLLQIRHDAIHGENAAGGDQLYAAVLCSLQLGTQVLHIVVAVTELLRLAEADAVDDAGVVQFITDDCILGCQQCFKKTRVGIEAGRIQDRILFGQERAATLASRALCSCWVPQTKRTEDRPQPYCS